MDIQIVSFDTLVICLFHEFCKRKDLQIMQFDFWWWHNDYPFNDASKIKNIYL